MTPPAKSKFLSDRHFCTCSRRNLRPPLTGTTDEFGFGPVENPAHVHDIHATILHQLGLDHKQLFVRSRGLDFRLTGVEEAKVIRELIS